MSLEQFRYVIRPNMLDETPYLIYGPDNTIHYGRNLGDEVIEDARNATGYYIVHGGSHCKQRKVIVRRQNRTYEGRAMCLIKTFKLSERQS